MVGRLNDGLRLANHALWLFQLNRVEQLATRVALVPFGISVVAERANTPHKAIGQGGVALSAETLFNGIFEQEIWN